MNNTVKGIRATFRSILYESHKYDLGCPKEENCSLFKNFGGLKACEGCPKHLKVNAPELDPSLMLRVRYILHLENLVNVGCKFSPNDLSPKTWDHMIVLAQERNWIREKVNEQRRATDKPHPNVDRDAEQRIEDQRKSLGVPSPGQSIFPAPLRKSR